MNSLPEPLPYRKHLFHLVATSKFHQETPSFSRRWFFGALKYCLLSSVIVALLDPSHGRIQRTIGLVLFLGAEGFWRIFQVWLHFDWSPPHFINNIYIILYNIILYYYIIYIIYMFCCLPRIHGNVHKFSTSAGGPPEEGLPLLPWSATTRSTVPQPS